MHSYDEEFPLLRPAGLYAADIRGDGNCLFNALSDQLYGSQNDHHMLRARTIEYMKENAEYYKMFLECHPGGGLRRNPKRKTAGGLSNFNASMPTVEEIDRAFQSHLDRMAKGGTWGDNMEIVAFSEAFEVDVKIYQRDNAFMVSSAGQPGQRPTCHIAYHAWEHYSSIRNLDGPHQGPPNVQDKDISPADLQQAQARLDHPAHADAQKLKIVKASLPMFVDDQVITRALEECRGNINNAVDKLLELLDADDRQSTSSQQSSIDRESDSSDESARTPSKKQDRRLSRATKSVLRAQHTSKKRQIALKLETYGDSLDSLLKANSPAPISPQKRGSTVLDSEDEDSSPEPLKDSDTSSGSEYSIPAEPLVPTVTGIKLRLSTKPQVVTEVKTGPVVATPAPAPAPASIAQKRMSARDTKVMKKAAQKTAAKERKQANFVAASNSKKAVKSGTDISTNSHPTMTTGIRTLYI